MNAIKPILLSLFIILVISACSNAPLSNDPDADNLDPTVEYQALDVSYGTDSDQRFDIYLPEGRSLNTKIMILVHGGGWTGGDKSDMNSIKDFVKQEHPDLGIVNMNYRLADANNSPYPMQIDDISTVIGHLTSHQNFYVIDDDFGFIGVSAGGHLSLLWSYAFDSNNNIEMVCSIVGPTNFTDPAYLNNTDPILQELLDLYGMDASTDFLEEVSPYHRATSSAPPTILFYGGMDPLIPTSQGTDMRDKLDELNVIHQFTLYPNAGHGWVGLDLLDTVTKLKAFTQIHLE